MNNEQMNNVKKSKKWVQLRTLFQVVLKCLETSEQFNSTIKLQIDMKVYAVYNYFYINYYLLPPQRAQANEEALWLSST